MAWHSRAVDCCRPILTGILVLWPMMLANSRIHADLMVDVPATSSIYLAGQPDGTVLQYGGDTAPQNSPIRVDLAPFSGQGLLSFSVSGATSRDPNPNAYPLVGPDGETPGTFPLAMENFYHPPLFALSGMTGPYSSLVAVFLNSSQTLPVPPDLDFGTSELRAFSTLAPALQQVFFIGDGLTRVSTGDVQSFQIPAGADELYLGTFDDINNNNVGQLQVSIAAPPVPEPATLLLLALGTFGMVAWGWRGRNRSPIARARVGLRGSTGHTGSCPGGPFNRGALSANRHLCGLMALAVLARVASQAEAQPSYVFSTIDFPEPSGMIDTRLYGINNTGQIVGQSFYSGGFLYSSGSYTLLGGVGAGGISNSGQIVGWDGTRGYLLSGGTYAALSVPGSSRTDAFGINNLGQIVGEYVDVPTGNFRAFLLSGGSYTTLDVPGQSQAWKINDAGQIVGFYGNRDFRGFLLSGDSLTTLDVPGAGFTQAFGINNAGEIVGAYGDGPGIHGFLYQYGSYTRLDVPGSTYTNAFGINDAGQIVGYYDDVSGIQHGFLATPVPEPYTLLLLGTGTLGVLSWVGLRKNRP